MSFTSIPNQPIIFTSNTAVDCPGCGGDYKQLLDFNDQVFFQLESEPCDGVFFSAFGTALSGWTSTPPNICGSGGIGSYSKNFYVDFQYTLYSLTIVVPELESGTLYVRMVGSSTYELTLPGTYNLYFNNPTLFTGESVSIIVNSSDFVGCFTGGAIKVVGLASVNQIKIGIVDAITLETVDVFTPLYTVKDNKITGAFRLSDVAVSEGCYRLAMADFCTNTCSQFKVYNNLFNSGRGGVYGWDTGGAEGGFVTLSQNSAYYDLSIIDSEAFIVSEGEPQFCTGKTYNISLFIESRNNAAIYAAIGDEAVVFPAGTGLLTVTIVAGEPTLTYGTSLIIRCQQIGTGPGYVNIERVEVSIAEEDIQWDMYSDVLSIGDYDDECKYFQIEGCNAEDQFNLAFGGSSFLPAIRLEGRKFRAQYVTEVNNFRFASGRYQTTYVDREKKWTFAFGRLPEYVLDFLSTIFYYDNCYVNGDLYYAIDGEFPDVEYNDADDLGAISIDLALKSSKVRKTICSDTDADCLPSILDNPDEPFLLTQDDNRLVTEDSTNLYYEF